MLMRSRLPLVLLAFVALGCSGKQNTFDDPNPKYVLPDQIEKLTQAQFDAFKPVDDYAPSDGKVSTFDVDGNGASGKCTATLEIRPLKSGGKLKQKFIDNHPTGVVVARIANTTDCPPIGFYAALSDRTRAAALVARPRASGGYEAVYAPFPLLPRTEKLMNFTFCGHKNQADADVAERHTFDPNKEDPCKKVLTFPGHPSEGGDDSSLEPSFQDEGGGELLWLACSRDCCPASQPPDTVRVDSLKKDTSGKKITQNVVVPIRDFAKAE